MTFLRRLLARYVEIIAEPPHRSRERAVKALRSDLIATIADHMMKVLIFGHHAQERKKWIADLNRQLREMTFEISKFSARKVPNDPDDRTLVFKKLHFSASRVLKELDEETADAYRRVLAGDKYKSLSIKEPHDIEHGVFSTLGYSLKDADGELGKGFQLSLDETVIVNTTTA